MQSTANYLWHTDDLLGQGATASVYKARNKVGPSPGPRGPLWPRQPPWAARWCVAGQRPLDLALHTLGSGTLGACAEVWELQRAPWPGPSVRRFGTGVSDENTKLTPGR